MQQNQTPKIQDLFSKKKFRILITGPSESGKTEALYQLITNPKFGLTQRFCADQVNLISPNQEIDDAQIQLLDYLRKHKTNKDMEFDEQTQLLTDLNIANNYIKNLYDSQFAGKLLNKQQKKEGKKQEPLHMEKLLILDDILGNPKFKTKKDSILDELLIQCRHVSINVIILSQYYKNISPVVRTNCSHFLFFNIPISSEIQKIKDEVSGTEKDKFNEIYEDATCQQYHALLICQQMAPKYKFFKLYDNDKVYQYNL